MTKTRVLLADEEALNMDIPGEYFGGKDAFSLHTAESGEAAWPLQPDRDNDLKPILLDRMTPEFGGIALARMQSFTNIPHEGCDNVASTSICHANDTNGELQP